MWQDTSNNRWYSSTASPIPREIRYLINYRSCTFNLRINRSEISAIFQFWKNLQNRYMRSKNILWNVTFTNPSRYCGVSRASQSSKLLRRKLLQRLSAFSPRSTFFVKVMLTDIDLAKLVKDKNRKTEKGRNLSNMKNKSSREINQGRQAKHICKQISWAQLW